MGWFFGFNHESVITILSNGYTLDIRIFELLKAKLYLDRGYISQNLNPSFNLITFNRKNVQALSLAKADMYNLKQRNKT